MKNIFRKSVQIFHKKDKGSENGASGSPTSSPSSKKDKKNKGGSSGSASPSLGNSSDTFVKPPLSGSGGMGPMQNGADEAQLLSTLQTFVYNPDARKVFGEHLQNVPRRNGSNLPIIVEKLIDHLEKTALTTEGVFRIPGRDILITHYVKLFDNGDDVDVSPIEPYTAAGLLKRFFRDLPVFVPQQINKRVASLFVTEDGKKRQADLDVLNKLRSLVHQLPPVHFEVMQALTGLLSKLMAKSDQNKMTISNIAICLVPTLNCVPAIVTYPIQYYDFFFNEVFTEHHNYQMRPYQTNLIGSAIEEKLEHLAAVAANGGSQPMLIPNPNGSENRRYSRPASITVSGLLPNNSGMPNNSPSSTFTSTTITSPHDSVTPITFTVTTTFTPPLDDNTTAPINNAPLNQTQPIPIMSEQPQQPYNKAERRGYKLENINTLDLTQFIEDGGVNLNQQQQQQQQQYTNNKTYLSPQGTINSTTSPTLSSSYNSNNMLSSSPNSYLAHNLPPPSQQLQQDMKSLYRRSVAIGNTLSIPPSSSPSITSPEDTKAAIQSIKDKIDRSINQSTGGTTNKRDSSSSYSRKEDKEKEKLVRYSIDFEKFKDRYQREKKMEKELEKRISPRERINILLQSGNSTMGGSLSGTSGSFTKDKSYRYSVSSNNSMSGSTTSIPLYQQLSNRYSNRYTKSDLNDEYYYYEQLMYLQQQQQQHQHQQQQQQQQPIPPSYSTLPLSRQRSQSCFEPENLINIQQNQQLQQSSQPTFTTSYIENQLDKIKDLINSHSQSNSIDNRMSRDYSHYLREVEELKSELQKESVASEFYATKNQELQDKLKVEEEKNQRLMDEIQLLESYFLLKEKAKLSKRMSTTKELLTRSRSPTLPTSINPLGASNTINVPPSNILNSSSNSVNSFSSSPSSTSSSSKDQLMNQMLRGPNRNLVNLIPATNQNQQPQQQNPILYVSQPPL